MALKEVSAKLSKKVEAYFADAAGSQWVPHSRFCCDTHEFRVASLSVALAVAVPVDAVVVCRLTGCNCAVLLQIFY